MLRLFKGSLTMRVLKLGAQTILIASSFSLSLALQVHRRYEGRLLKFKLMLKALFDSKYPLPSLKTDTVHRMQ